MNQELQEEKFDNDKLIEIFKIVIDSESLFPVWSWKANGLDIWPLLSIRFLALAGHHFHTKKIKLNFGPPSAKKVSKKPINEDAVRSLLNRKSIKNFLRIQKKKITNQPPDEIQVLLQQIPKDVKVLLLGNTVASYNFGKHSVQHHTDAFRLIEESNCKRTANLVVNAYKTTPLLKNSWISGVFPFGEIQKIVGSKASARDFDIRKELPGFQDWENFVCKSSGLADLGDDKFYNMEIKATLEYITFFEDLFAKCKFIEKVYQVCYYGPIGYALNFVCRKHNIPSIDIQHGVQGKEHRPYYFPNIEKKSTNILPTLFLNWTKEDADNINSWASHTDIKTEIVDITWKKFLKAATNPHYAKLPLMLHFDAINEEIRRARWQRDKILQSSKCKFHIFFSPHHGEEIDWLEDFLIFCQKNNFFVWFRLHPADLKDPIKEIETAMQTEGLPASVHLASRIPLPFILEKADLHVTNFSSTTIEANAYKIPTISYSKQGMMFFKHNCTQSDLVYAESLEDLKVLTLKYSKAKEGASLNTFVD